MSDNRPIKDFQYPRDDTEYKAKVIFQVKVENYTTKAATNVLSESIDRNQNEIKKLVRQRDEIVRDLKTDKNTQFEYNEQLKNITSQIRTLKDGISDFHGAKNVSTQKSNISSGRDTVSLYLPLGLSFRDNVTYENFDLGATGALMEQGMGFAQSMVKGVGSFVKGISGSGGADLAKLAGIQLASKFGTFADEAAAAQKLVGGVTLNPNSRILFKQPNIREFSFTFKMIAKSAEEAKEINDIIKLFRTELYPDEITAGVGDTQISLGYKFPNKFDISFEYNGNEIPGLSKIQPCFLRDVSTTYNSSQMAMHSDGNFMEVDMNLSFQETRALVRSDIVGGY